MSVFADNFHYKSESKNRLSNETNISQSEIKKIKERSFADQFFALPSLEGFNGRIALNFDKLGLDDLEIKNFKLAGNIFI